MVLRNKTQKSNVKYLVCLKLLRVLRVLRAIIWIMIVARFRQLRLTRNLSSCRLSRCLYREVPCLGLPPCRCIIMFMGQLELVEVGCHTHVRRDSNRILISIGRRIIRIQLRNLLWIRLSLRRELRLIEWPRPWIFQNSLSQYLLSQDPLL